MNKKNPKTNPPKPLDSPKLQEIRAGSDLKLQEGKGGKRKSTESQRRLLHGEEVNVFKL